MLPISRSLDIYLCYSNIIVKILVRKSFSLSLIILFK